MPLPKLSMGNVVARRVYMRVGTRSSVVIEIGTPQELTAEWKGWGCPVRITGLRGHPRTPRPVLALDSVQCLELALMYVEANLSTVASELALFDGRPGELFLPSFVPSYLPQPAQDRVNRAIEKEVRRVAATRRKRLGAHPSRRGTNM
jgi:hypothetical protein